MFDAALGGTFRGLYIQGEDIAQSDPNTQHVEAALRAMDLVVVQDLFLNETARFAHVFLPGTSFLEKDGTFTNAERRINRVRPVFASKVGMDEWEITCAIGRAMGYETCRTPSASEIMDEIAATTPTFAGVSFARLDEVGSMQWPVFDTTSTGTPIMHVGGFVRGKGKLIETVFVPTTERSTRKFPLILTTGRILSQYNVGAQTRRTANNTWHPEDVLEIHPADAEMRGISTGDLVDLSSRVGSTTLRASVSERMPAGVVYTTFHHPVTGANVVTTENSDWATNCPEYKVTAVQVGVANARGDAASRRDPCAQRTCTHDERMSGHVAPEARMGNDIARQFAHLPPEVAAEAVARHIETFWDPRMRRALEALVAAHDDSLDPLAGRRGRPAGQARRPFDARGAALIVGARLARARPGALSSAEGGTLAAGHDVTAPVAALVRGLPAHRRAAVVARRQATLGRDGARGTGSRSDDGGDDGRDGRGGGHRPTVRSGADDLAEHAPHVGRPHQREADARSEERRCVELVEDGCSHPGPRGVARQRRLGNVGSAPADRSVEGLIDTEHRFVVDLPEVVGTGDHVVAQAGNERGDGAERGAHEQRHRRRDDGHRHQGRNVDARKPGGPRVRREQLGIADHVGAAEIDVALGSALLERRHESADDIADRDRLHRAAHPRGHRLHEEQRRQLAHHLVRRRTRADDHPCPHAEGRAVGPSEQALDLEP